MRRLAMVVFALCLAALPGADRARSPAQGTLTPISQVQGSGNSSPLQGQVVTVRGVVTALFPQGQNDLDGFFVQDPTGDGDEATSEGLFVYRNNKTLDIAAGALVDVTGTVKEYLGLTELSLDAVGTVEAAGPLIAPATIALPAGDAAATQAYFEHLESMRVALPAQTIVGASNHFGEAYGVPAASQVTAITRGDAATDTLMLGLSAPSGWLCLNQGDHLDASVGVLAYTFGAFKVAFSQDSLPRIVPGGRQPSPAPAPPGENALSVATYNVENFFDPVDDPGKDDIGTTPSQEQYPVEVARRARSITLGLGNPDVLALEEVENLRVLQDLVASPILADKPYVPVLVEGPDARGIDVALLYDSRKLSLLRYAQHQACTTLEPSEGLNQPCTLPNGGRGAILFGRPPLEVVLVDRWSGQELVFLVNHFKSKSGGDTETRKYRVAQADFVRQLAGEIHAARPAARLTVLGDLNDFEDSAMIHALTAGGDLETLHPSPLPAEDYSYVFNGVRQVLDHILVWRGQPHSPLGNQHINADFCAPAPADLSPTALHTSDHDPLVTTLPLPAEEHHAVFLPLAYRGSDSGGGVTPTPRPPTPLPTTGPGPSPTAPGPRSTATRTSTPSTGPPTATPGAGPPRTPLRILKVFYDGTGSNEPDEYVEFQNVASAEVDLTGWHLISVQGDQIYPFPSGKRIAAGQVCRVYTNEDHPESCGLSWGSGAAIWANAGDKAELRDAAGLLVDHACYGNRTGECP